ncbi:metal-dependent hydrolase [Halomonas sp. V046]|uniref:metal-dependent hydrolase n=1 Tax=Halomonas sp. V046 TaxID=3459611 RepID=UPI0040444316
MDSITQAALGAALGGAVMGRRLGRKSLAIGAVLGSLPDMDVIIDYGDAVANVTYHRGFSHSLFVLTGLATLLAGLAVALARRLDRLEDVGLLRWWALFWLCLATHPLLDSITTYGTQLWWPLTVTRPSATPLVFIIDPLYTLPLLIALGVALWRGRRQPARLQRAVSWGLVISSAYLLTALGAKSWVASRVEPVLADAGLTESPRLIQPVPFTTLLWRVTVIDGDRQLETLVGVFDGDTSPRFETFRRLPADAKRPQQQRDPDGAPADDLEGVALATAMGRRLDWFAGPFLRYEAVSDGGVTQLQTTDLRLGFPGFHPFRFALAELGPSGWQPLTPTLQLDDAPRERPLAQLWQRIFTPQPPLCLSSLVEPRLRLTAPPACRTP